MRLFPFLVARDQCRIGLRSRLVGLFPVFARKEDIYPPSIRDLSAYLLRDIGLSEPSAPDWDRLLR